MVLDPRLIEILCCPACREAVRALPDELGIECAGCRRVYPVVDGIPVMLVEESAPPAQRSVPTP
jgi:uncharacterized protein YbaR (Trm112 family)